MPRPGPARRPLRGGRVATARLRDGPTAVEATRVPDTLVLCYHAISETWPAALSTTPERFEAQLDLLLRRGYRPQTFTAAIKGATRKKTFAVTFDDAYRSVLEL